MQHLTGQDRALYCNTSVKTITPTYLRVYRIWTGMDIEWMIFDILPFLPLLFSPLFRPLHFHFHFYK